MIKQITIEALADAFGAEVRATFSSAEIEAINAENVAIRAQDGSDMYDAIHDRCDGNQLMLEAWERVTGSEPDLDDLDIRTMDAAWEVAMQKPY